MVVFLREGLVGGGDVMWAVAIGRFTGRAARGIAMQ
jgi:hypothetical protein